MRDKLVPGVIALLCIAAVALGAAALTSDLGGGEESGAALVGSETNGSDSPGTPGGGNAGTGGSLQPRGQGGDECIAGYNQTEVSYVVFAVLVAIALAVVLYTGEVMLGAIVLPILMLSSLFVMVVAFSLLGCPVPGQEAATTATQGNGTLNPTGGEITGEGEGSLASRLLLLGIFSAISIALLLMGLYVTRRNSKGEPDEQTVQDSEIAAAAEEAADEIEHASTNRNPIYAAWAKMTEPLDVEHPEASTPQEFADAALEAGLNGEEVRELTELFETVRYGTTPVTTQHEKRAREALRRIERDHSEGTRDDTASDEGHPDNRGAGPASGDSAWRER